MIYRPVIWICFICFKTSGGSHSHSRREAGMLSLAISKTREVFYSSFSLGSAESLCCPFLTPTKSGLAESQTPTKMILTFDNENNFMMGQT